MRSTPLEAGLVRARRAWEAPAITELPIGKETRSIATTELSVPSRNGMNPSPPPAPASKLGFSFEMSFPLSVRTE